MTGAEMHDLYRHVADLSAASVFVVAVAWVIVRFIASDRFR